MTCENLMIFDEVWVLSRNLILIFCCFTSILCVIFYEHVNKIWYVVCISPKRHFAEFSSMDRMNRSRLSTFFIFFSNIFRRTCPSSVKYIFQYLRWKQISCLSPRSGHLLRKVNKTLALLPWIKITKTIFIPEHYLARPLWKKAAGARVHVYGILKHAVVF